MDYLALGGRVSVARHNLQRNATTCISLQTRNEEAHIEREAHIYDKCVCVCAACDERTLSGEG